MTYNLKGRKRYRPGGPIDYPAPVIEFKHYELVERAKQGSLCKICGQPIIWKASSFSNLTCSPKCRAAYKRRQSMSMVL